MPLLAEIFLLTLIAVIPLINPFFLHQELNLFELSLYLPGIDAINQGLIPYRDFFHLRGPFELYLPAWIMNIAGADVAVLSTYFYITTILTVLVAIWLARLVMPCRWILYVFVPVLVARTFPRVVFTYWGGMRYVWGLLAIGFLIKFIQSQRRGWLFGAGILTAVAGFTSCEIGISAGIACIVALIVKQLLDKRDLKLSASLLVYTSGVVLVAAPYLFYLAVQGALVDYFAMHWYVITGMKKTFLLADKIPSNIGEVLHALIVPTDKSFRQMTPVYAYIIFIVYLWWRRRQKLLDALDFSAVAIAVYGLFIYVTGFRNLQASVFEMSLQPQKIVLFYLIARAYLYIKEERLLKKTAIFVMLFIIISSLAFSFGRFKKRFFTKLGLARPNPEVAMDLPRLKHHFLPVTQAEDLKQLQDFIDRHVEVNEPIWMFPELGTLHFILNRPWVGRFPTATLSWFHEPWFNESLKELQAIKPRYALVNKAPPDYFAKTYFPIKSNQDKYAKMIKFLNENYVLVSQTPTYNIFKLK